MATEQTAGRCGDSTTRANFSPLAANQQIRPNDARYASTQHDCCDYHKHCRLCRMESNTQAVPNISDSGEKAAFGARATEANIIQLRNSWQASIGFGLVKKFDAKINVSLPMEVTTTLMANFATTCSWPAASTSRRKVARVQKMTNHSSSTTEQVRDKRATMFADTSSVPSRCDKYQWQIFSFCKHGKDIQRRWNDVAKWAESVFAIVQESTC